MNGILLNISQGIIVAVLVGLSSAVILLLKSLRDFSQTGPRLKQEVLKRYSGYTLYAVARLSFWAFLLCTAMAAAGVGVYGSWMYVIDLPFEPVIAVLAGIVSVALLTGYRFCHQLLYSPGVIAASSHYRLSRFYPLWRRLTPGWLHAVRMVLVVMIMSTVLALLGKLLIQGAWVGTAAVIGICTVVIAVMRLGTGSEPKPVRRLHTPPSRPNIIMIGSDTLRSDRLGAQGYPRPLTPCLDALAARGVQFLNCYVPCARTAPSLVSLFTGAWPHQHGVRDNFVAGEETRLSIKALPEILAEAGYVTAAVSDWCGADLGKFPLGFQRLDLPEDQWNVKYLIRQGPKDLRLFLSLFFHNRIGKHVLPEIYYLAGVPLTRELGRDARAMIGDLAEAEAPFFLNVFLSTTHPPFASEYPYYTLYASQEYVGNSKFMMSHLTDPFEIIRRQGDGRKEFDLDQIIDLYDGCVKNFDDEVAGILAHLEDCGLADNTIIVIYSDHGMEFFEHDTWGQGNSVVGDFSPKVPLIIVDPRLGRAHEVNRIVRNVDIAPTLLDLVGLSIPHSMTGVSLKPYLLNPDVDLDLRAFNESGIWLTDLPGMPKDHLRYPNLLELLEVVDWRIGTLTVKEEFKDIIIEAKDRMVRWGNWKLVYQPLTQGALCRLFDLSRDPECRQDVSAAYPEVFATLKTQLVAWMQDDRLCYWDGQHLCPRRVQQLRMRRASSPKLVY